MVNLYYKGGALTKSNTSAQTGIRKDFWIGQDVQTDAFGTFNQYQSVMPLATSVLLLMEEQG